MRSLSKRYSRRIQRVQTLKDSDYDHEINLEDQEDHSPQTPGGDDSEYQASSAPGTPVTPEPHASTSGLNRPKTQGSHQRKSSLAQQSQQSQTQGRSEARRSGEDTPPITEEPVSRLSYGDDGVAREDHFQDARESASARQSREVPDRNEDTQSDSGKNDEQEDLEAQNTNQVAPSIEVEGPTPGFEANPSTITNGHAQQPPKPKKKEEPKSEIDILWENERGCFLCGRAVFSAAALGNLDPPAWTNRYFKTSPTNIRTATVPDPSWEWAWSEWRINREENVEMDEFGWEYSFMFSKKFSWHGPKWWNSFVRRRAWIRKRVKKSPEDMPSDPHMLNTDYFSVTPARTRASSMGSSHHGYQGSRHSTKSRDSMRSKPSLAQLSKGESILEEKPDIEDIWMLMLVLRAARIDREKVEAVENYLEHATDGLEGLQNEMHEIMSIFIFQASRRLLLSRLTHVYEEMINVDDKDDESGVSVKRRHLKEAIKHADEEVKKLSYWSDVKGVAEGGESRGATSGSKGWGEDWEGVDQSGPAQQGPRQEP